jgi:methanogenic corrinoid protein MtbC1
LQIGSELPHLVENSYILSETLSNIRMPIERLKPKGYRESLLLRASLKTQDSMIKSFISI